jgi:WD40 repeat protein
VAHGWREVRVFISSTFCDMHAERDHLVKVVFPRLRERLEQHRIHLVDIDLRWGVTADQADNDRVLDLCLEEIDRSRPFFVGILGQRYGWVLQKFPEPAVAKYGWIQGLTGKSITDLEIHHGVMRNPAMAGHALFYFRDDAFLKSLDMSEATRDGVFLDEHGQELATLKTEIRGYCTASGAPLREYPCGWDGARPNPEDGTQGRIVGLDQFGDWVEEDLFERIRRECPQVDEAPPNAARHGTPEWLPEEQDYHERFIESRLRVYVGREAIHQELTDYIEGDSAGPLLVSGGSGSGKSAVLGRLWESRVPRDEDGHPLPPMDALFLPHFVGASPASTSLRLMLQRFCMALRERFNLTEMVTVDTADGEKREEEAPFRIPEEPEKLPQAFQAMLKAVPDGERAVIVIDGVNQLDEQERAQDMYWLPVELPNHVKVVVSCVEEPDRDEPALDVLRRRNTAEVAVPLLTDDERRGIVRQLPSVSAKTLDDHQVDLLLSNPATTNPLYLSVVLEELRGFGGFGKRGEVLEARIARFPSVAGEEGLNALFDQVIERLESELGRAVVHDVLTLIASARRGLAEQELEELITGEPLSFAERGSPDTSPKNLWGQMRVMLRQLRPYLLRRGPLIDFYHRNLFKATRARYLGNEDDQRAAHGRLADFFSAQPNNLAVGSRACGTEATALQEQDPPTSGQGEGRAPARLDSREDASTSNTRKVDELPWQLSGAESYEELEELLTTIEFLQSKVDALGPHSLLHDFELANDRGIRDLAPVQDAIRLSVQTILREPRQLPAQLHGRLQGSQDVTVQRLLESPLPPGGPWIVPKHRCYESPDGAVMAFCKAEDNREICPPVALSPDARFALTGLRGDTDHCFAMWDLNTTGKLWDSGDVEINAAAFSPDERHLLVAEGHMLKLLELPGGQCVRVMAGHTDSVVSLAFSLDGTLCLSGSEDATARLWDIQSGSCLRTFEGHSGGVNPVAFSDDGLYALSAANEAVKRWELASGACLTSLPLCRYIHTDFLPAFSRTGRYFLTGAPQNSLELWEIETGKCVRTLAGHDDWIASIAFFSNESQAVSAAYDGKIKFWNVQSGECTRTIVASERSITEYDHIDALALSVDNESVASISADGTLTQWRIAGSESQKPDSWHGLFPNFPPERVPYFPEKRAIAVSVSPDGRYALSGGCDMTTRLWDIASGECIRILVSDTEICGVEFSLSGRYARSRLNYPIEQFAYWDLTTGEEVGELDDDIFVQTAAEGLKEDIDLRVSSDGYLYRWDLSQERLIEWLPGEPYGVRQVIYLPDSTYALALGNRLNLWEPKTGRCVASFTANGGMESRLQAGEGAIGPCSVAPNGRDIVAGTSGGRVLFLRLEGELESESQAEDVEVSGPQTPSDSGTRMTFKEHVAELGSMLALVPLVWAAMSIGAHFLSDGSRLERLADAPVLALLAAYPVLVIQAWRFFRPGMHVWEHVLFFLAAASLPVVPFTVAVMLWPVERLWALLPGGPFEIRLTFLVAKALAGGAVIAALRCLVRLPQLLGHIERLITSLGGNEKLLGGVRELAEISRSDRVKRWAKGITLLILALPGFVFAAMLSLFGLLLVLLVAAYWANKLNIGFAGPATTEERTTAHRESDDEFFHEAVQVVLHTGQASISMIQRRLRVGYARASELLDLMEKEGIVGPHRGSEAREILVARLPDEDESDLGYDADYSANEEQELAGESDDLSDEQQMMLGEHLNEAAERLGVTMGVWFLASVVLVFFVEGGWFARITDAPVLALGLAYPVLLVQVALFTLPGLRREEYGIFFLVLVTVALAVLGLVALESFLLWHIQTGLASVFGALYAPQYPRLLAKAVLLTPVVLALLAIAQLQAALAFPRFRAALGLYGLLVGWCCDQVDAFAEGICSSAPFQAALEERGLSVGPATVKAVRRWGLWAVMAALVAVGVILLLIPPVVFAVVLPLLLITVGGKAVERAETGKKRAERK